MSSVEDDRPSRSRRSAWEKNPFAERCGCEEDAVGSEKDHPKEPASFADCRRSKCEVHVRECKTREQLVGTR